MRKVGGGAVARVFIQQPDRIAAAWRRVRHAQTRGRPTSLHLIDELVEPFVREVGMALLGTPGSPWSRTRGLLRISAERGARGLYDEFAALRRCMTDALEALGGGMEDRRIIASALDEAVDSAVAICQQLQDPRADPPLIRFGGVVVEIYEPAEAVKTRPSSEPASLH